MFEIIYRYEPDAANLNTHPKNASEAKERLIQGNAHFANLVKESVDPDKIYREFIPIDLRALGIDEQKGVPVQQPFAAVLSCSDARVPIELIFNQACNDLFVIRLAGNIITNEGVGSIGYSVNHLDDSIKLIVVMGHTCCGAVTAAVDSYLEPATYPGVVSALGLRSIIDRIFVSVRTGAKAIERAGFAHPDDGDRFRTMLIKISIVLNSAMMAMTLSQLVSTIISSDCEIVYGVYDLVSHRVWAPNEELESLPWVEPRLTTPPRSLVEFELLADRMALLASKMT